MLAKAPTKPQPAAPIQDERDTGQRAFFEHMQPFRIRLTLVGPAEAPIPKGLNAPHLGVQARLCRVFIACHLFAPGLRIQGFWTQEVGAKWLQSAWWQARSATG